MPIPKLKATPANPMLRLMRVPYMMRDSKSRPCSSPPRKYALRFSSTPNRCRSLLNKPHSLYESPRAKMRMA